MTQQLTLGFIWAYRVGTKLGTPAIPAKVLQFGPETAKHKVRVKYLDGEYSGLDEWVPKTRLVVPWESHDSWWEDELNQLAALELGGPANDNEFSAVMHVFAVYRGESVFTIGFNRQEHGLLEIHDEEAAIEALEGSGVVLEGLPGFYRNRWGDIRASWHASLQIAKQLCKKFTEEIATATKLELRGYEKATVHGRHYGRTYIDPETAQWSLEHERPMLEMVLSWCEVDDVERIDREQMLQDEVQRLRGVLQEVVTRYRNDGHPHLASNLEKRIIPSDGEQ